MYVYTCMADAAYSGPPFIGDPYKRDSCLHMYICTRVCLRISMHIVKRTWMLQ